ncbi:MAG: hypothetical protein LC667_16740 [Thioalkalivibrio sp.]|nr:hypothetical protein [Thioalkalivibrio sp.]
MVQDLQQDSAAAAAVITKLRDFINQVHALPGCKVSNAATVNLVQTAEGIIASIDTARSGA